jgi:hypothetical protein
MTTTYFNVTLTIPTSIPANEFVPGVGIWALPWPSLSVYPPSAVGQDQVQSVCVLASPGGSSFPVGTNVDPISNLQTAYIDLTDSSIIPDMGTIF